MIFEMAHWSKINFLFRNSVHSFFWMASFLLCSVLQAQDTIIKRNDERIIAKILEVNPVEIKYNLYNYREGPVFVLPKWELKSITYGNGLKESFDSIKPPAPKPEFKFKKDLTILTSGNYYLYQAQRITELDMLEIAKNLNDKRLNAAIRKTKDLRFARKATAIGAVASFGFGFLTYNGIIPLNGQTPLSGNQPGRRGSRNANLTYRHTVGAYFMLGGLASEAVSFAISLNEKKHAHMVVKMYNKVVVEP